MASGPKRQPGPREPNGRLQRLNSRPTIIAALNAMERKRQEDITAVARMQPHRQVPKGMKMTPELEKMQESALGRFLLAHMQDERRRGIYFDAGLAYGILVARYKRAWGAEAYVDPPQTAGTGEGPSLSSVAALGEKITAIRQKILRDAGSDVMLWTDLLLIDELDVPTADPARAINGLWIIATELNKLDSRLNKVA